MGQKTHPLGFRLGITQTHKANWYTDFYQYASILEEDDKIRTHISNISKISQRENDPSIANLQIDRNGLTNQIQLKIETGKPGILVGDNGNNLKNLFNSIKKLLPNDRQFRINVSEIEKIDLNAALLANFVAEQLERRIAFRRAIREALKRAVRQNVNGIKIQVSGRLNGAEIARSEWIREGRVPLQTLRADIDYATKEAHTIYGVLGIKVWLFKSEVLSK